MANDAYTSPLASRYASPYMLHLFSPDSRFQTWRRLWVALARAQHQLGLPITARQVQELEAHVTDIDYEVAAAREREVRHDVMAHVYTYGKAAPSAAGILHLGATSCYVTDNADLILYRDGLRYLRGQLLSVLADLAAFARRYAAVPTLGYTHYQPAQPVTVGKRATLWMQDFLSDVEELDALLSGLKFLGCRGTTGTEASFMDLFDGDEEKIDEMNRRIAAEFGFSECFPVCGQTYPRKVDSRILSCLSSIAQSAYRMAGDIRLLQHDRQLKLIAARLEKKIHSELLSMLQNERETYETFFKNFGLQTQPHALRAHLLPEPLPHGRCHERPHDCLHPVAGAHAGRLRQPPHRPAGGIPLRRRHPAAVPERSIGPSGQRDGGGSHSPGVPALHGHRKPDDGGREAGRRPPAAP